jgi:RNase P subunit RPR2
MTNVRQFTKIQGNTFTAQCASCGISHTSNQMYSDSDRKSLKYKAHYCASCACMLVIASSDQVSADQTSQSA